MRLLLCLQALPQLLQPLSDATVGLAHALKLQQLPPSTADESTARIAHVAQSLLPAADEVCSLHRSRSQPCSKPVWWLHEGCDACLHGRSLLEPLHASPRIPMSPLPEPARHFVMAQC